MTVLDIQRLTVSFGAFRAVDGVSLAVEPAEIVGIVGESGSGKSTLAHAIPRLLPPNVRISAERLSLAGIDLQALPESALVEIRGAKVAMVFQDPSTSFSPLRPIGRQLEDLAWRDPDRRRRVIEMLASVGIADPERRARLYPHELSGGMLQRIAIAAALMARPALIIADEPTTALDVTNEAQILHLLRQIRDQHGTAILIISHQLGVIAEISDSVAVMAAGAIVEQGPVDDIFHRPAHPYTRWLIACEMALRDATTKRLPVRAAS